VKFGIWGAGQFRLPEIFTLQIGRTAFPIVWAIIGAAAIAAAGWMYLRKNQRAG
jgi:hypothetical protein